MHDIWKTLGDGISNQPMRDMTGVKKIEEFMREQRLRWFWYVELWTMKKLLQKQKNLVVAGSKKGRPKKRWKEVVENHMLVRGLRRTNAQDRSLWKLDCKNRPTSACSKNKPGSRMIEIFINTPKTNNW